MEENRKSRRVKCVGGLWGLLFGHNYHPVFEEQVELKSAVEIQNILVMAQQHNFMSFESQGDPKVDAERLCIKNYNESYSHSECSRCGHIIKDELSNISK